MAVSHVHYGNFFSAGMKVYKHVSLMGSVKEKEA